MGMGQVYSKKNLRKDTFVGRNEALDYFKTLSEKIKTSEHIVLNYFGLGGMGKTTLLNKIKKSNINKNRYIFTHNCENQNKSLSFYNNLISQLKTYNIKSIYFSLAFLSYWTKLNPNLNVKENPPAIFTDNEFYNLVLEYFGDDIVNTNMFAKGAYKMYKKFEKNYVLNQDIMDEIRELNELEILEIENRLPKFLSIDLKIYLKESPSKEFLFLFDTYEDNWEMNKYDGNKLDEDEWVTNLVAGLESVNCMFILAGREELLWHKKFEQWNSYISKFQLDVLSFDERLELLEKEGIKDDLIVNKIARLSEGYPFYFETALELYNQTKDENTFEGIKTKEEILIRFKRNLSVKKQAALEFLSLPRYFDESLYLYMAKKFQFETSQSFFEELTSFSFFKIEDDKFRLHNLLKNSFIQNISEDKYIIINKTLFEYYDSQIETLEEKNRVYNYYVEAFYHLVKFASNEKLLNWFKKVKTSFIKNGDYSFLVMFYKKALESLDKNSLIYLELMIELASLYYELEKQNEMKETIDELSISNVPLQLLDNLNYLKILFELSKNRKKLRTESAYASKMIEKLFKVFRISDEEDLKAKIYIQISKIYRYAKAFDSSKNYLMLALKMTKSELIKADIYDKLGLIYRDLRELKKAIKVFSSSLEIKLKHLNEAHIDIAKTYRGLSEVLILDKNKNEAIPIIIKTIKIFSSFYNKESSEIESEYRKLSKILEEKEFLDIKELDLEMKYLILLNSFNDKKDEYINKLLLNSNNLVSTVINMSRVIKKHNKVEAFKIFDKLDFDTLSLFERWQIAQEELYLSKNEFNDKNLYLEELLNISMMISEKKYIGELQRSASIYNKFKKYEDTKKCYDKILAISEKNNDKYKLAEIYKQYYYLGSYCQNKQILFEFIEKEKQIWLELSNWHNLAKTLTYEYEFYKNISNYEKMEKILLEIKKVYFKAGDLSRVDSTNGKIIELYIYRNRLSEALDLYNEQIKIRIESKDVSKISKGYKFLSDFYLNSLNNPKKGEEILYEGLKILLNYKSRLYEDTLSLYFYSMEKYFKKHNKERIVEIINFRIDYLKDSCNTNLQLKAYNDLEDYYRSVGEEEEVIKLLNKQLELVNSSKNLSKKIHILLRFRKIYYKNDNSQQIFNTLFELFTIHIELKDFQVAKEQLHYIIEFNNTKKYLSSKNLLKKVSFGLEVLLKNKKLTLFVDYINNLIEIENISEALAYFSFANKTAKIYKEKENHFLKLIDIFYERKNSFAASIFYYVYVDLKLSILSTKFDEQEVFYNESLEQLNKYKNWKLFNEHKTRFKRFKKRMENSYILNGRMIDSIIVPIIERLKVLDIKNSTDEIFILLKEYTKYFSEDEMILEKIKNQKMVHSVFMQGVFALIKDFSPLKLGFINNEYLLRILLTNTSLCSVKKGTNSYIIQRSDLSSEHEVDEDIYDYNNFIHTSDNYAAILTKLFFDNKNGIYFPSKENLLIKVLTYLGENSIAFNKMKFQEIVDDIVNKFEYKDSDILRATNVVKNLYYSDVFSIDFSYKEFEEKLFSIELNYNEIIQKVKDFAYKSLNDTIGSIDTLSYEKLFYSLSTK